MSRSNLTGVGAGPSVFLEVPLMELFLANQSLSTHPLSASLAGWAILDIKIPVRFRCAFSVAAAFSDTRNTHSRLPIGHASLPSAPFARHPT
ncbi:hypothetical protein QC761_0077510 [Podospora bellae-mahoneyi]|uniref:Uncharacterized protein n=1 Tax=Podospora bellae-mahoneyi TaxID=2093777 RepID=A0ABR0FDC8_9PEZI|nr:hypothetical protein QC761_0077510 [Podospora bellae-mahoneyi]